MPDTEKLKTIRAYFIEIAVLALVGAVVFLHKENQALSARTNEVILKQTEAVTAAAEVIRQNTEAFNQLTFFIQTLQPDKFNNNFLTNKPKTPKK